MHICPICRVPARLSARPGFRAAACGHSLLVTTGGVTVASRDLSETAGRAQSFIERATPGALLAAAVTAPVKLGGAVTVVTANAPANLDGIGSPEADVHAIDDMPSNKSQPLAACVTTRELPGTVPQKIYGKRGITSPLDGGPVANVKG